MKKFYFYLLCFVFLFNACKKDNTQAENNKIPADPSIIQDQYGRQLILRGLNTSNSAKADTLRSPWIVESDVARENNDFGFDFVRYLIFWDAIEPQKDVFDDTYLDRVEQRVNWYTSRGMYVMLDMHQDLYSIIFGGDGAPEWACRTNGAAPINLPGGTPWWLKNIDPAVINSWINFWSYSNHKDLQDHYILAWKFVMERFKNNPYVIGYDLMNEPWGGDLIKVFITGEFESVQLTNFYKKLIPALRTVEPNKYLFFEPTPAPVTFGAPSKLSKITDSKATSQLVYAPHCYPFDTHEGNGYTSTAKQQLKDWERERKKELKLHNNIPLLVGEFGLSPDQSGFGDYLVDFTTMADSNQWHWSYWSNDLGGWSPLDPNRVTTPILPYLVRTYPKATAGKIKSFKLDNSTKEFVMTFISDNRTNMPTEIFVPNVLYPNGWELEVSGTTNYTQHFDNAIQTLSFSTPENQKEITIKIRQK
ncbi:MAG: cellulase family glycosylhydrolase [Bacteroidetes bacterium]|nr:cellulase family glycosylhydrolase [Bacteroidota bacterium]